MRIIQTAKLDYQGLTLTLAAAAEKPAPGQPGKKPGEVQMTGADTAVVSLGAAEKLDAEAVRRAGGGIAKWARQHVVETLGIEVGALAVENGVFALCEGLLLGGFQFTERKSKVEETPKTEVHLLAEEEFQAQIDKAVVLAEGVNLVRAWGHEPPNILNPAVLAERCRTLAEESGLSYTLLDDKQLVEMGAGAIAAVGQASQTGSRLIVLEYAGQGEGVGQKPVVLVGKAITFDTGGYTLKSREHMLTMKYDMLGGAAVAAVLQAAAALKLQTPVVGLIAAAENMISRHGYRPDDIITSLSGQTIEIVSTDAEGRMVMSDALTYAQREFEPRALIDIATLTGGVVVSLGDHRAGLFSRDQALADALTAAGERTHELLWQLPLDDEYFDLIKSDDADFKNSSGVAKASAIVGATFLRQFVEEGTSWAHLDIAGTGYAEKDQPYGPKGGTGFGVRLLAEYLEGVG